MIHSSNLRKLFAALLLVTTAGCQISRHKNQSCDPNTSAAGAGLHSSLGTCSKKHLLGSVQTGGQFARARVLPINRCGLTLSEAVDQTIRDGLRTSAGATATQFEEQKSVTDGITDQQLALGHMNRFDDLVGKDDSEREKAAASLFDNVFKDVVANPDDVRPRAIESIVKILEDALPASIKGINRIRLNQEIRNKILDTMNDVAVSKPQTRSMVASPKSDMTYYQTAVRVRRKNGDTLIFPLWLVDRFQAGDVALRDGDAIDVSNCNRSELFNSALRNPVSLRNFSESTYSNTTIKEVKALDRYIDLLRVTHVNRNGLPEEYFIPKNNNRAYGENPGYAFMLNQAQLSTEDAVSPENLSLSTVIRRGRKEALARSAELLNRKAGLEALDDHQRAVQNRLANVPVVGDLCEFVESTTGFNWANATSSSHESLENAIGLIPSP